MSIDKARDFLKYLAQDKELQKKFSGFNMEELKKASQEMKGNCELSEEDLTNISGGYFVGTGTPIRIK
jgi:bacteriocin-like protein